jgi:hypothetical protein
MDTRFQQEEIMKKLMAFALLVLISSIPVMAETDLDLDQEVKKIDANPGPTSARDPNQLSERYGVPLERVHQLRDSGKGWGAVKIELALAEQLALKDPVTYPTTADALARISALRAEKQGYGVIARDMGIKVGDVMRSTKAEKVDRPMQDHTHPHKADRPDKVGKPDKVERPAKMEKLEHPNRPDKPGR